jgi:hypothetical protein
MNRKQAKHKTNQARRNEGQSVKRKKSSLAKSSTTRRDLNDVADTVEGIKQATAVKGYKSALTKWHTFCGLTKILIV